VAEPAAVPRDALALFRASEGAITGTVVCAAAIAAGAGHLHSTGQLSVVILGTIAVYWVAHLHAETIGSALTHRHHPLAAVRHAFWETVPIAAASVVPLGVLLVTTLLGAELKTAARTAVYASVALLAIYSYVAGGRGGLDLGGRLASAAAGAGVGLLVVVLKAGLH
jgi:hypothetical protein